MSTADNSDMGLTDGPVLLGNLYGSQYTYLFAIGLLAASQVAVMTLTYVGALPSPSEGLSL